MKEPILVMMAAGMGSRYGGLKQLDPVGPDGEPRGVLRLPVGDVEGYLIESRSQAICLLPDEAAILPAMLGQAAGPLCEKFGLTRRAQPSPPAPRFEDALREEYGDVY